MKNRTFWTQIIKIIKKNLQNKIIKIYLTLYLYPPSTNCKSSQGSIRAISHPSLSWVLLHGLMSEIFLKNLFCVPNVCLWITFTFVTVILVHNIKFTCRLMRVIFNNNILKFSNFLKKYSLQFRIRYQQVLCASLLLQLTVFHQFCY